jgi:hypothetical protein
MWTAAIFLENRKDDRHHFRIILSPEDAGDLQSLNQFTRDVMGAAEKDLGTRLDWVEGLHSCYMNGGSRQRDSFRRMLFGLSIIGERI